MVSCYSRPPVKPTAISSFQIVDGILFISHFYYEVDKNKGNNIKQEKQTKKNIKMEEEKKKKKKNTIPSFCFSKPIIKQSN